MPFDLKENGEHIKTFELIQLLKKRKRFRIATKLLIREVAVLFLFFII
jgi:hypothetical protein